MKVLVTGAAGFVGRRVVAELGRRGHAVVAVVRRDAVPPELDAPHVELLRADLRLGPAPLAPAFETTDAIVHLAAGTTGSARARFDATVLATEGLLDALVAFGWPGRFVHVSSLAVYGFNQLRPGAVIDERTPLEPRLGRRDDYAWTKTWQERLVRRAADRGLEICVVRPGAIHGPERRAQQRLGRRIGDTLLLFGGRNRLPLCSVENVGSLLAEVAEHPAAAGETFNAVDPDPPRQAEYVRRWRDCPDGPTRVLPVPLTVIRAGAAGYALAERATAGRVCAPGLADTYATTPNLGSFRYDGTRATRVLGWHPPVGREAALAGTFAEPPADGDGASGDPRRMLRA